MVSEANIIIYSAAQAIYRDRAIACFLVRKSLHAFLCPGLNSSNLTVIKLEEAATDNVYASSVYMSHNRSAPPQELQDLSSIVAAKKTNLLISCGANATHTLFDNYEINDSVGSSCAFIMNTNLSICSRGCYKAVQVELLSVRFRLRNIEVHLYSFLALLVQTHFLASEEDCESEPCLQSRPCETTKSVITKHSSIGASKSPRKTSNDPASPPRS